MAFSLAYSLLPVVLSLVGIWLSYTLLYNLLISPLAKFPGPKLWAISRIPSQRSVLRGRTHIDIARLHAEYGPVVRIGPNELAFNTPQAFKDIYGFRSARQFLKDPSHYTPPVNGVHHIVSAIDPNTHARHRSLLAHAFSERALHAQEGLIRRYVDLLVEKLRAQCQGAPGSRLEPSREVDIKAWLNYTTFDIMGDLMFGESFQCLEDAQLHPWISFIFNSIKALSLAGAMNQFPWLNSILMKMLPKKVMQQAMDHFNLSAQKVDWRLAQGETERPDFLTYILKNGVIEGKERIGQSDRVMSRDEIHSNAFILIIAGSETSASLLSGAMYYLCKSPPIMAQLQNEIRAAFASDEDISFHKAATLPFLNAVIEESLRIYPPFVTSLARVVPKGGETVDGRWVPGNTIVACHHYASYHSASNFASPDEFAPERWLNQGSGRYSSDQRGALNPFSLGPFKCIGVHLAYAEIRLILCKLLYNFDIQLCSQSENWADQDVYFLWDKPPLMVLLKDRFA